jgi:hypothetical protein
MAMNFSAWNRSSFLNQKTAGDSETASDVEDAGFATELLLTDFVDLGRSV